MVFVNSTSGGSSYPDPFKLMLSSLFKMDSMACLLLAAICFVIVADTFSAILVNLLLSRF